MLGAPPPSDAVASHRHAISISHAASRAALGAARSRRQAAGVVAAVGAVHRGEVTRAAAGVEGEQAACGQQWPEREPEAGGDDDGGEHAGLRAGEEGGEAGALRAPCEAGGCAVDAAVRAVLHDQRAGRECDAPLRAQRHRGERERGEQPQQRGREAVRQREASRALPEGQRSLPPRHACSVRRGAVRGVTR